MPPNTLIRRGYKGKFYVKNKKKILQDPKQSEKSDPDPNPEKITSDQQH
jgi:hypothetical protein